MKIEPDLVIFKVYTPLILCFLEAGQCRPEKSAFVNLFSPWALQPGFFLCVCVAPSPDSPQLQPTGLFTSLLSIIPMDAISLYCSLEMSQGTRIEKYSSGDNDLLLFLSQILTPRDI